MKRFQSVAFKSIIAIVVPLLLFAVVVGFAGNQAFTEALQEQYAADAFHIADTAAQEIDADQMEQYLKSGGKTEAYRAV